MLKFQLFLCVHINLIACTATCQVAHDAVHLSLGHMRSVNAGQWSVYGNPAGIAVDTGTYLTCSYANNYLIPELDQKNMGFSISRNGKAIGLSAFTTGDHRFIRNNLGLSYSQYFNGKFALGMRINYLSNSLSESYGSKSILFVEFGLQARVKGSIEFSLFLYNPTRQILITSVKERLPSALSTGLSYRFSEVFLLAAACSKSTILPINIQFGAIYQLQRNLKFRLGFEHLFRRFCFGLGVKLKYMESNFGFSYEPKLGIRSAISLSFCFDKKVK